MINYIFEDFSDNIISIRIFLKTDKLILTKIQTFSVFIPTVALFETFLNYRNLE